MEKNFDLSRVKSDPNLIKSIVANLLPPGKLMGDEYTCLNPTRPDKKAGSFRVNVQTGLWCEFSTGDSGDILDLVKYINGCSFVDAKRYLMELSGHSAELRIDHDLEVKAGAFSSGPGGSAWKDKYETCGNLEMVLPARLDHKVLGRCVGHWIYRNQNSEPILIIRRFDKPLQPGQEKPEKDFLPLSFLANKETGVCSWVQCQYPGSRPIFNIPLIMKKKSWPVVIVEGEKAAAAAQEQEGVARRGRGARPRHPAR